MDVPSATVGPWGSCAAFDPVGMAAAYAAGLAAGPEGGREAAANAALCDFCGLTSACASDLPLADRCRDLGCVSVETSVALGVTW